MPLEEKMICQKMKKKRQLKGRKLGQNNTCG